MSLGWELVEARGESSSAFRGGNSVMCVHVVAAHYEREYINAWDRLRIPRYFCIYHFRNFFVIRMCLCSCCRTLVFMLRTCAYVHVAEVCLCPCCVRAPVFMLRTRACVHVAERLCSCCGRALMFTLRMCACVHVVYVRLSSCCGRALVFM